MELPFYSCPESFEETNRRFNTKESAFLDKEITSLLQSNVIEVSDNRPHCVSRISVVPKKQGSFRLIMDLQQLNKSCAPKKIIYENIEDVVKSISVDDQLVTISTLKMDFTMSRFTRIIDNSWVSNGETYIILSQSFLWEVIVHLTFFAKYCKVSWNI